MLGKFVFVRGISLLKVPWGVMTATLPRPFRVTYRLPATSVRMPSESVSASGELVSVAKLKKRVFWLMLPSEATAYFQMRWPSL